MPRTLVAYSLLSLAEAQRACASTSTPAVEGDVLENMLDAVEGVTSEIEAAAGRRIVTRLTGESPSSVTEYHTGESQHPATLYLGQFPVIAIASVDWGYWGDSDWVSTETVARGGTGYTLDAGRGVLTRLSGGRPASWSCGFEAIRVIYTAGYANTAAVPQSVKEIARSYLRRKWAETSRGNSGAQSFSDGMGSVTRFPGSDLLRAEIDALARAGEVRYHTTGRAA
jgi:hypothetical protein